MTTPTIPSGYFSWAGGECPVPGDSRPDVMHANGRITAGALASNWGAVGERELGDWWKHTGLTEWNIIAYRPDPNYVAPIDWQAKYEAAEEELAVATENYLSGTQEEVLYALNMREERDTALAELAALRAKAEKLAGALKPFACAECRTFDSEYAGRTYTRCVGCDCCVSECEEHRLDCDWLLARAALSEWEGKP